MGCFLQNSGETSPQIHPLKNRVFHYFHHPFWGTTIFGNTHMVSFAFLNVGACLNSQHAGMSPIFFPAENLPIGTDLVQLLLCQGAWEVGVNLRNEANEPTKQKQKMNGDFKAKVVCQSANHHFFRVMWVFGVTKLTTSNNQTKLTQKYNSLFFWQNWGRSSSSFFLRRCFLEVLGDNIHEWTNRRYGSNTGLPHHNQTPRLAMASCCCKRQWWMQNRRSTVGAHSLLVNLKGLFSPPNMWAFRDASPRHPGDTTCENEEGYPRFKKQHISIHMVTVHECASSS